MTIIKIFTDGIRLSVRKFRTAGYVWGIQFLFSLAVIAPVFFWLKGHMGRSLMGDRLKSGLDFLWLGDISKSLFESVGFLSAYVLVPVFAWLILQVFLNGGIIGRLLDADPGKKPRFADFMLDCGQYAGPFFRLFLLSLPVYGIVTGLVMGITGAVLDIFTLKAVSAIPVIIADNIKQVVFLIVFSIINLFFDYVKIRLVISGERKAWKAIRETFRFVFSRFFRALGLYWLSGGLNILVMFIYLEIARLLTVESILALLGMFIWQQAYIMGRTWIKVLFFATQAEFFRRETGADIPCVIAERDDFEAPGVAAPENADSGKVTPAGIAPVETV